MPDVTVLLTCAGQRVDIVRAFRAALDAGPHTGRVLVSDADELSPSRYAADAVVALPLVDDPSYGAAVAEACRGEGVRAVVPLTDLDPVVLARSKDLVQAAGAHAFVPDPEVAHGCQDKWRCHLMLTRHGLPSPPTWLGSEVDPADLPYPVRTKAVFGYAGRHIHRCDDAAQLAFFLGYIGEPVVVQADLSHAAEFSIDCLGDLRGRPLGAVPRSMIQGNGREQVKGETLGDPRLVELGAAVVERLGIVGPCTVQGFRDDDGRVLGITDINTRFGGGFPLPQAAGADYPAKIIAMAAGEEVRPALGEHRAGVVMTRFLDQTFLLRGAGGLTPM